MTPSGVRQLALLPEAVPRRPSLSIIVPTLNRGAVLHRTIRHLLDQSLVDFELIIIDQSDPAGAADTRAFLDGIDEARIDYRHVGLKNLPNARNEGLKLATADIVLFVDDDIIPSGPDFLQAHLQAFDDPSVGAVTGRTIERAMHLNSTRTQMDITWGGRTKINLSGHERQAIAGLKGANMSFRRAIFAEIGGFDRNYVGSAILEDIDISVRVAKAGWALLFEPKAELFHLSSPSGGVRVEDAIQRESWRFQMTAYFLAKSRGQGALLPFAMTFGAIALMRALRWRRPGAVAMLAAAARRGARQAAAGPDQLIGETTPA